MNKVYVFSFDSMWLGGTAVVIAKSEEEGLELLEKEHGKPISKNKLYEVKVLDTKTGVKYYYNGDY